MAKPPQRLHPWGHRGCDPQSLLEFVSATLREDHARVQAWLERPTSIAECIEVLIRRHRLGAFLFSRMHGRECWESLPLESRQRLIQSKTAQDLIASQSLDTLETVREQLASRGIPFVVLKGVEIATRFYGATAARGYRDIDLLISERDRDATLDCLQTAGWHRLSRIFLSTQFASKYQHAFDYRKGDALLDLHWALTRLPGLAISTEEVMSRAQSQRLADSNYQVLDQVDELVLLLISAFADIQRGALRLQSFVDIALVSQRLSPPDWDRYHAQVNKSRAAGICQEVLRMMDTLLGLSLSPANNSSAPRGRSFQQDLLLLLPSLGAWRSKQWAMQHLPVSSLRYAAWWMVSLPARTLASHPRLRRPVPKSRSDS